VKFACALRANSIHLFAAGIGLRFLWTFGQCRLGRSVYRQLQRRYIFFVAKKLFAYLLANNIQ